MADPATITAVAKAAAAALSDERTRKTIGWILAAILSPLILIVVLVCSLLSGTADHNNVALDLSFHGGVISGQVPENYRQHITDMQTGFTRIDSHIAFVSAMTENGNGLDSHWVKAVFYALYFGTDSLEAIDAMMFVDCFVTYEERTRTVDNGDGTTSEKTYIVAVPLESLDTVYVNIAATMNRPVTDADRKNADEVYNRIRSGGDAFSGGYERNGEQSIELDASTFTNPANKNNRDLVIYATHAWESGWGYVWGTYGSVLTESLLAYKLEQYPDGVGKYEDFIRNNWLGDRTTDCVGLIKGYGWLDPDTLSIGYGINGMPDVSADQMYKNAEIKGSISTMPDIPGLAVWHEGHIGVYIGNGEVIEAMGTKYGVVKTRLADRNFTAWLEVPYISYLP